MLPRAAHTAGEMKKAACAPSKHHSALCQICRHPDREEIDRDFLHWTHADALVREYGLGSSRAVYRHAHACGLYERRQKRLRFALYRIVEHVSEIKPTPAVILGAIRLIYQMDQKEKECRSPESGSGGGKSGDSAVHYTIDSYPYFDDCFEPLPKEAKAAEAAATPRTGRGDPAPTETGQESRSLGTAPTNEAAGTSGRGAVPAPACGAGRPVPTSSVGVSPAAVDRSDVGAKATRPQPPPASDPKPPPVKPSAPAKGMWRSLAGRRGRWARRGHVIVPHTLGPGAGPP